MEEEFIMGQYSARKGDINPLAFLLTADIDIAIVILLL